MSLAAVLSSSYPTLRPAQYMYSLWNRGWTVVPVRPGSKAPLSIRWSELAEERSINLLPNPKDKENFNIALYLGNLVDLDVEFDITHILPGLFKQMQWLSRCPVVKTPKGVALLFSCPELAGRQYQVKDNTGALLLEVRSGRRYRIVHGHVSGMPYRFIANDIINSNLTPADLPSVSVDSVQQLVKMILNLSGHAYSQASVEAICPAVSQYCKSRSTVYCSSSAVTFQQFKDSILKDADLFGRMFERYGHTLPAMGRAFLCPFHSERNPSAAWDFDRNSGRVIFIDYHRRGEDGRLTYDLVDCYAALKEGDLRHISDPQEYLSLLYDLTEELDVLPEYVRITKGIVDRYATYIKQLNLKPKDRQAVDQVWALLARRCLIQKLYGSDVFGDSVRWIADQIGLDPAAVNRSINLLCALELIEKTDLHSSQVARRPDRFRLVLTTVYTQVKNTFDRLVNAGATTLRKLNQNLVHTVLGVVRTISIFRRQSDKWEQVGRRPKWLTQHASQPSAVQALSRIATPPTQQYTGCTVPVSIPILAPPIRVMLLTELPIYVTIPYLSA